MCGRVAASPTSLFHILGRRVNIGAGYRPFTVGTVITLRSLKGLARDRSCGTTGIFLNGLRALGRNNVVTRSCSGVSFIGHKGAVYVSTEIRTFLETTTQGNCEVASAVITIPGRSTGAACFRRRFDGNRVICVLGSEQLGNSHGIATRQLVGGCFGGFVYHLRIESVGAGGELMVAYYRVPGRRVVGVSSIDRRNVCGSH